MRRAPPLASLAAAILLIAAAPADVDAGERRSVAKGRKIASGYTIAQIGRGASIRTAAETTGFETWRQPRVRPRQHTGHANNSRGIEPEALIRPPAGAKDPVLMEFGLPHIPGVPLVAILLPPPGDELARLGGLPGLSAGR